MRENHQPKRRTHLPAWGLLLLCLLFVCCAPRATAQSITGHVFEDQGYTGGSGRTYGTAGTASGVNGARVELYTNGGNYICTTTTATNAGNPGYYIFNAADCAGISDANRTYTVRVVNDTVISNYTGGVTGMYPVQTFGTCQTVCETTGTAVTTYVGGLHPAAQDPGNGAAGAGVPANSQSLAIVELTYGNTTATGIDFGFNFFTIVNTNATGQGSLANFVTNANTLTGATNPTAIFMISNGAVHNGMNATYASQLTATANGSVFRISAASMPTVTATGVMIDATNEITNIGGNPNTGTYGPAGITLGAGSAAQTLAQWAGPCVEIMSTNGDQQWQFTGASDTIKAFAFAQFGLYLIGNSDTAQDNIIGMHADETYTNPTIPAEGAYYGVQIGAGTGITVNHNIVAVNNSAIRHENVSATNDVIEYNDVDLPSGGQNNTFDGILMVGPGTFTGETIKYNYVHNLQGGGIEVGFSGSPNTVMVNENIQYNTVQYNGWVLTGTGPKSSTYTYSAPSTEPINIAVWGVTSGSTVFVTNNLVSNAGGVGVLIENAYGFTISQNSIYQNGYSASYKAAQGPGISLFNSNIDPNGFGTSTGITPNTGVENPAAPNNFMNYPVLTMATYTAANGLRVKGYVGGSTNLAIGNAIVELFIANNTDGNQSGNIFLGDGLSVPHGEGQTYLGKVTANAQGLFDQTITPLVAPTAGTSYLTSTATDAVTGSTSEFGPNLLVEATANTIQGYVYDDVNHDGALDLNPTLGTLENWQAGTTVYAVLWDTTCNFQAEVGTTKALSPACTAVPANAIPAQLIASGAASDTGFFSFDNVTPGTAAVPEVYEILLTTTAPGANNVYTGIPTASIPAGWMMINPNTFTASFSTTPATPQTIVQNFGLYNGSKIGGVAFKDNGAGTGGIANDGKLNGTEPGIPNLTVSATSAATVVATSLTDGAGNYALWIPAAPTYPVTITFTGANAYTSTGSTGTPTPAITGTMNTSTVVYTITAGLATATSYTGLNFGFIQSGNIFQPNGQQTTVPGAFATYTHQYTSVTGGTVTFTETPAVSQPNYFTETLYTDKACSGSLLSANATSIAWGAPQTIAPGGGILCIIVKENVTPSATYGMSNAVTLTSTFNYGTSVANTVLTLTDITTIDTRTSGELQLVKSSYIDTGCTNPANPTYLVTTQSASSTQCIKYQIQATNSGAAAVANVVINDSAPPFTTLVTGTGAAAVGATGCTGFTVGTVTSSASPTVSATFTGSMPAGCVATFVYEVRLN